MKLRMSDVATMAWDTKKVVAFLRTIKIGSVKSTHELADEFCNHCGVADTFDSGWYAVLNNMCAGFDYLLNVGDLKLHRDSEGMVFLTFIKNSGFSPR